MLFKLYHESPNKYWHLFKLVDPENIIYELLFIIHFPRGIQKLLLKKQKVNDLCACKSNKKYKKCCKQLYDTFNSL